LARGGSKGILNKNIINFCGHPLLAWTVMQLKLSLCVDDVWISSDSENILNVGQKYGAIPILRPRELSEDKTSSESAWMHALDVIQTKTKKIPDYIVAPQVTSPLRDPYDIQNAVNLIISSKSDSLLSATEIEDFFIWEKNNNGLYVSKNYNYLDRKPRQDIKKKYLENGSFYIFKPEILRKNNNRLGGRICIYTMPRYKMFQIDNIEDVDLCLAVMKHYNFKIDNLA
jgi:N-acylneuraminate cytidylyltransferase